MNYITTQHNTQCLHAPDPDQEKKYLESVVESLERDLKAVKDWLKELAKGKPEK